MNAPPTLVDGWHGRALIEAEAAELSRRFPGVVVWFGFATRHWWAMVATAGRWRLVEANGSHDLSRLIDSVRARPNVSAPPLVSSSERPRGYRRRPRGRHVRRSFLAERSGDG
jgi:hypothetical protein